MIETSHWHRGSPPAGDTGTAKRSGERQRIAKSSRSGQRVHSGVYPTLGARSEVCLVSYLFLYSKSQRPRGAKINTWTAKPKGNGPEAQRSIPRPLCYKANPHRRNDLELVGGGLLEVFHCFAQACLALFCQLVPAGVSTTQFWEMGNL